MLSLGLLITLASLCGGAVLVSEEDGKQIQLQEAAAFGYEILEHRLDNLQNTYELSCRSFETRLILNQLI